MAQGAVCTNDEGSIGRSPDWVNDVLMLLGGHHAAQ